MPDGIDTRAPTTKTVDWAAWVRRVWGDEWMKRDTAYEFSNGRRFEDSGPRSGIYSGTGA